MRQLSYVIAVVAAGLGVALMTAAGCFPFLDDTSVGGGGGRTSSSTGGTPCTSALACDDGNPCTAETCTDGSCVYIPLDKDPGPGSKGCMAFKCDNGVSVPTTKEGDPCGVGLKCVGAVCTGCSGDNKKCGKTDECQTSICQSDMTCKYDYKPIGTKVAKLPTDLTGDCMATTCDGIGNSELTPDALDVPDDGVNCTDGHCLDGKPVQTPSVIGAACMGGAKFCNATQMCVECAIDANCPAPGATCYQESGCVSCTDNTKNGDETDKNCGGSCSPCDDKKGCVLNKDCKSMRCESGTCISCFDGVQNGDEVDVDCGGTVCLACPGTVCAVAGQCALGHCENAVCCDKACGGVCKSCNVATKVGLCSDSSLGLADPACPSATPVCDTGVCVADGGKKHLGDMCGGNSECFSNNCQGTPKTCK